MKFTKRIFHWKMYFSISLPLIRGKNKMIFELVKKETKEHIFSRKGIGFLFFVTLLMSILSFSFISVKELSLLDQPTVVMTMLKLLLGINILISMVIGSTMIAGEKV